MRFACRVFGCFVFATAVSGPMWATVRAEDRELLASVKQLCHAYLEGFGHADTRLCYHHRLNGPRGIAVLSSPEEIAEGVVQGKSMPWGYGSGIQDVALENGQSSQRRT